MSKKFRCPKNGQFVSEFTCMYCKTPPVNWKKYDPIDSYEICRVFNNEGFNE